MKKIVTLKKHVAALLVLAIMIVSTEAMAQPDYQFSSGTLTSGTALTVGAVYKFTNVKTGVDATLTISAMSPGMGLTELDGTSGYPATIQPTITANAWTSGYVELTIVFKTAGTNSNMSQPEIAVTAFDVDGVKNYDGAGHDLHEFDQINIGGGYTNFNTVNNELSISQAGNWFTGTNISGIDYPGRDTSAQQVMFSVIKTNVTTAVIRVGINNQTANSASRLRAIYFKKFTYQNSLLAINTGGRLTREKKVNSEASFRVFPTTIQGNATIAVSAEQKGVAMFEVVDYSGRVMHKQQLSIEKGVNNIPFNANVGSGNYIAVLKMDGSIYNQKFIKQY